MTETTGQKTAQIAVQFYDARKMLISLLGADKFKTRVEEVRPILERIMREQKKSQMEATIVMLKACSDDNTHMSMVLATCCEIMEPSL